MDVALRKESVDRNPKQDGNWGWGEESLSARRAWIEIVRPTVSLPETTVALRKESVDRNTQPYLAYLLHARRSPQGERG